MRHHNLQVTGSVVVNGLGLATTADLNTYTASADAKISTLQSFTASIGTTNTFTASASSRLDSIETITASNVARLTSLEIKTGSLASTGSNTFIGTQTITGSLFISANLIVQGTSSLENITASAVSIGTNIVNLNTANPAIRYAGLVIGDSGSVGGSGSFLYDSVQDEMIFVHRGSSTVVTSSVVLMGPQTFDTLGTETYPTANIIQKGTGNEHLVDSCIFDDGTTTCVKNNFVSTGTGLFCGQLNAITGVFGNKGGGNYGVLISDNDQSNVRLRFTNSGTGGQSMSIVGGNPGLSNYGLAFYDETNSSTRLYINSNGNIGINSSNPLSKLYVSHGTNNPVGCAGDYCIDALVLEGGGRFGLRSIQYDAGNQPAAGDLQFLSFLYNGTSYNWYERMRVRADGYVGINTTNPGSLLDVHNCSNTPYVSSNTLTSGQWLRISNTSTCTGATSGILFVASGPGGGNGLATINGVTTSCGSMGITFGTRNASGAATERMRIVSSGTVGIGTDSPVSHAGANVGGLVIKGINGCRSIIELWDGTTSGKAVFQQINGTTYLGNLDIGTGTGEIQLLVNGNGSAACTAMTLTKCGHIVVNNAPNSQTDYGRFTISTSTPKTSDPNTQEKTALHLSTCEGDYPFGMKFQIVGGACNCTRAVTIQTGDHYLTNQGNITMQVSGGHVGIGTSGPRTKFQVTPNYNAEVPVLGCASGIATFTSTNTNYGLQLNSTSDGSFHIQSQRFDGNATAYNLILNYAGGNVLVGTQSSYGKLTVAGTIASPTPVGGDTFTIDAMNGYQSIANGGYVDFNGMSGFLMVNNWSNGATTLFVMGGGNTGVVGTITGTAGTTHHNPAVGGYRWCNNYGSTANFGFQVFRTRNTA